MYSIAPESIPSEAYAYFTHGLGTSASATSMSHEVTSTLLWEIVWMLGSCTSEQGPPCWESRAEG